MPILESVDANSNPKADKLKLITMHCSNLSKDNPEHSVYASPVCRDIQLGPLNLICVSEPPTENVDEEDGEW